MYIEFKESIMPSVYDYECLTIKGESKPVSEFKGKVLLIVNTASRCGFTPQLRGLEEIYNKYSAKGLEVLGFPCNQFGYQDPGKNEKIEEFCQLNYGVSFPMFAKIDVNGPNAHPLFSHLKEAVPGVMGSKRIKWNFTKFLVDAEGNVVNRFAPATTPAAIEEEISKLLLSKAA
jgi:glutathione peroxidase